MYNGERDGERSDLFFLLKFDLQLNTTVTIKKHNKIFRDKNRVKN